MIADGGAVVLFFAVLFAGIALIVYVAGSAVNRHDDDDWWMK